MSDGGGTELLKGDTVSTEANLAGSRIVETHVAPSDEVVFGALTAPTVELLGNNNSKPQQSTNILIPLLENMNEPQDKFKLAPIEDNSGSELVAAIVNEANEISIADHHGVHKTLNKAEAGKGTSAADDDGDGEVAKNKKRKLNEMKENSVKSDGDNKGKDDVNPKDFLRYLENEESVGPWDVLCGRGGESNNHIGNKRYRKLVDGKKVEYRKIDDKKRKEKTLFVKNIVTSIYESGGRFLDVDREGKYYVVSIHKARTKTSQALRETKELKWIDLTNEINLTEKEKKQNEAKLKDVICTYCGKTGHKTKLAKACDFHHEWTESAKLKLTNAVKVAKEREVSATAAATNITAASVKTPSSVKETYERVLFPSSSSIDTKKDESGNADKGCSNSVEPEHPNLSSQMKPPAESLERTLV